jgi:hypothetical protein
VLKNIRGRFTGFTDISDDRSTDGLFSHVQNVVSNINVESKLMAQTYALVSVVNGHLNDLTQKLLEADPNAHVHCYAYVLSIVLSQNLSYIKECSILFVY